MRFCSCYRPLILLSSFLLVATLNAEVIFNNFGPDDTFMSRLPAPAVGGPPGSGLDIQQGFFFSPDADYYLDSVTATLSHVIPPTTNQATLTLYDTVDGLPGSVLDSSTLSDLPTLQSPDSTVFEFSGSALVNEGRNYFVVANAEDDPSPAIPLGVFAWHENITGVSGNVHRRSGMDDWEIRAITSVAARVEGTLVPEPGSFTLTLLVVTLFTPITWRTRRRN